MVIFRYMTLTHTCDLPWAGASNHTGNSTNKNLTDFGKDVVREMNRLGKSYREYNM